MKIKIKGINNGEEFEFPELTPADEEARLKAIIEIKKQYKEVLDIKEVEDLAMQEASYAMLESILKRVDSNVTREMLKSLPLKDQKILSDALIKKIDEIASEIEQPFREE